jgi:TerD domain
MGLRPSRAAPIINYLAGSIKSGAFAPAISDGAADAAEIASGVLSGFRARILITSLKSEDFRMAISLSKGGNVSLSKESPGLTAIDVGLGWDARVTDGRIRSGRLGVPSERVR